SNADEQYALSIIRDWKPDIIAHSSTSSSFYSVANVIKEIKRNFSTLLQICGGVHVSLCPDELLNLPELDAICIGYGEYPLLELAEAIQDGKEHLKIKNFHFRYNGQIIKNSVRDFPSDIDSFIPCDREIFLDELKRFSIPVPFNGIFGDNMQEFVFCRGCPYNCSFCCNHALKKLGHGSYISFPSVSKCMEELEKAKQDIKMTGVAIHDDIFTLNKGWFREFAEEYRKKVSLPYVCNLRVNCFNEDDVRYLKDSGCVIAILGIESGNEYIRNTIMRKGIKQEDIIKAYNLLHQYGIRTHSQNLIAVPSETPEHFLDTIRINARIMPNNASLSIFYPYPGTALFDRCENENLFANSTNPKNFQERRDTKLELPEFPRKDILFYVKNFRSLIQYEFLINKYGIFRRIFFLNVRNQIFVVFFMGILGRLKLLLSRIMPKYPKKA
ncbi:MAG: radical SAM protein, partial [Thermodesulfovibrionia bacterium]|nr:radical SAM protein [Thermodesulfovibrionia bacterium]